MKILVYGCGVIGSYLVHTLCKAGNAVTVVSKGKWGEILAEDGLRIYHQLQHRYTIDYPDIAKELPDEHFDMVFSVMQGCQQREVLPELAKANVPIVVLVGNNPEAADMERELLALSETPKAVLFGFQGTAGVRSERSVNCLYVGHGSMTIGGLHQAASSSVQEILRSVFQDTGYKLTFEDDMEGWLYCHAAFILPIVYASYRYDCNLRKATMRDLDRMLKAVEEAYGLIEASGIPIRPADDESYFQSKPKAAALKAMMLAIAKTKLGDLAATDHCRNAVTEMEWLDAAFETLREKHPEYPMPEWENLRFAMPTWERIHQIYDNTHKSEKPTGTNTGKKIAAALVLTGAATVILYQIKKRKRRS